MGPNWSNWACMPRRKVEVSMPRISGFTCCPLLRKDYLELTLIHLECTQRNNNSKIQNKEFTVGPDHSRGESGLHINVKMFLLCLVLGWSQLSGKWRREDSRDVAEGKSKAETTRTSWSPHRSHPLLASNFTHGGDSPQKQHVLLAWRSQTPKAAIQQKQEWLQLPTAAPKTALPKSTPPS